MKSGGKTTKSCYFPSKFIKNDNFFRKVGGKFANFPPLPPMLQGMASKIGKSHRASCYICYCILSIFEMYDWQHRLMNFKTKKKKIT